MPELTRPNIVVIHWHDLGTSLGAYGNDDIESPNLDRLAVEGVRFSRAFATAPLCTPARGSLFTGRYPHSYGLMELSHRGWEYAAGEAMLQRGGGYHSTLIGLQHESQHPAERLGYDEIVSTAGDGEGKEYCGDGASRKSPVLLSEFPHLVGLQTTALIMVCHVSGRRVVGVSRGLLTCAAAGVTSRVMTATPW